MISFGKFIMATENMLECLVADSAAFLKNAPLQQIAHKVFTIREVVSEIKDATTRQRLQVLPYTIEFREPSVESIKVGRLLIILHVLPARSYIFCYFVSLYFFM